MSPILAGEHFFAYHEERGIIWKTHAETEADCWDMMLENDELIGDWFEGNSREKQIENAKQCGWTAARLYLMTHGVLDLLLKDKNTFEEKLHIERANTWNAAREMHGGIAFTAEKPQVYERYSYQTLEDWEKARNG